MNLDECIRDGQPFLRDSAQGQRGLLVFVPGFQLQPANHSTLLKRFESDEQFLGDDILPFLYDSGKWSNADPQVIARELATQIDEVWQRRRPQRLYIVAHIWAD